MPRSDVLTLAVMFSGVGLTYKLSPDYGTVLLILGAAGFLIYILMGRLKIIVHYAGWGQGPNEEMLLPVTQAMQAYVDEGKVDVRASDTFLGRHYESPRMLKVVYSRGRFGERKTRVFPEHHLVKLD